MKFSIIFFVLLSMKNVKLEDNSTLILLQIVHRHGDRTPISFYNNDPYKDENKWLDGLGELTPKGKKRMYRFGQQLRKRYNHYLGDSPKNIYLRSSSSDRCLESASALVTGLYPPKDRWIWSQDLAAMMWQPIAVQTELSSSDGLLVPTSNCPAADAAYQEIMQSKEVKLFMDSQKEFIKKVEEKTGQNFTTLRQLDYLYDTIYAELTFDEPKPVPKWIKELGNDTLDRLKQFERNAFKYDWSSKKVQRLRAGLILQELITNMKNAIKGEKNMKKVYSYTTHDTMLVTILQALSLYSGIPPSYGAALLFELHRIDGQNFIHLFYANVTPNLNYTELELKKCQSSNQTERKCHLKGFIDSVKEFIPNDWHKECQISGHQKSFSVKETEDEKEDKNCSHGGIVVPLFVGFIIGVLTFLVPKLIKFIYERFLLPNKKRYLDNSYSVNTLQKRHQNIDKTVVKI